jgi:hypothetical protein
VVTGNSRRVLLGPSGVFLDAANQFILLAFRELQVVIDYFYVHKPLWSMACISISLRSPMLKNLPAFGVPSATSKRNRRHSAQLTLFPASPRMFPPGKSPLGGKSLCILQPATLAGVQVAFLNGPPNRSHH